MVTQPECGDFIISANILGDTCGYAWNSRCFPFGTFGNPDESTDGLFYLVYGDNSAGPGPIAVFLDGTVVSGSQPPHFVERWMQVRIAPWRQRTAEAGAFRLVDNFRVNVENRFPGIEQREGVGQDPVLKLHIAGHSERASEWKIAPQSPGRGRVFNLLANGAQGNGSESGLFKNMRERTHGTRAERSHRGE